LGRRASTKVAEAEMVLPAVCRVTAQHDDSVAVFSLLGALVVTTAPGVRELLDSAGSEKAVVVDLTNVTEIDTLGLAALRDVVRQVAEGGGRIALTRSWRQSAMVSGLVGSPGLVFFALSASSATAWLTGSVAGQDGVSALGTQERRFLLADQG
jgi:anti-anti-sigma factor